LSELMMRPEFNTLNPPWQELALIERALGDILAHRHDATVSELAAELARLQRALAAARGRLEAAALEVRAGRRSAQLAGVVDALLPAEIPSPAGVWHAQRSAEARLALVSEHGAWTAAELAQRAGSMSANRSALASAWRAAGRILGVEWGGRMVFPAFQFTADAQPRPVIAAVLERLRAAGLDDWQAALWFASPTGWLDDRRPVDVLAGEPEAVETAAAQFDDRPT
jgi:hypothetical protein